MNEWNDLLALTEADDEAKEEKEKEEKKEDEKESEKDDDEDKKEDEDDDDEDKEDDDDYNDLIGDDDLGEIDDSDDLDTSTGDDDISSDASDSDYNTLIVAKVDGDTESESSGSVYEAAAKLGYTFTVISNNMKHIHLNATGRKFEELHEKCDKYYSYFSQKADWCFELASESPLVKLDNPTRAKEHCEDVEVEQSAEYGFEEGFGAVLRNFDAAITATNKLREAGENIRPDVQSRCDDVLEFLNKESKYFIRKRLAEPTSPAISEEEPMGESYNVLF